MATGKKNETALVPAELSPKLRESMALAVELSKSGIVPMAYAGKPQAIFAAIQYGKEFGLPPMTSLQNIAVINGKPTFGTDMLVALAMRNPEWGGYEIKELTEQKASVVVYRKSPIDPNKILSYPCTFTMKEAEEAGLVRPNSPWTKWRKRMLKHRAVAFAIRDAFPDLGAGKYTNEEMDPDFGAMEEAQTVAAEDAFHAAILDDEGVPVEIPVKPVSKKRASPGSKVVPGDSTKSPSKASAKPNAGRPVASNQNTAKKR